jgi:hypothetical protein
MDATNSSPAVDVQDEAASAAVVREPAGSRSALPQQDSQPAQPKPQKELLCTICNLRACWEAPAGPADGPAQL